MDVIEDISLLGGLISMSVADTGGAMCVCRWLFAFDCERPVELDSTTD